MRNSTHESWWGVDRLEAIVTWNNFQSQFLCRRLGHDVSLSPGIYHGPNCLPIDGDIHILCAEIPRVVSLLCYGTTDSNHAQLSGVCRFRLVLCLLFLPLTDDGTKTLHLWAPGVTVWSATYIAPVSSTGLRPLLRELSAFEPFAIGLGCVLLLGLCRRFSASATVSPAFSLTALCLLALRLVQTIMFEVCQGLGLSDGLIDGFYLTPL